MKTADFDFILPEDRIARAPAKPRDSARLLVVGAALADRRVSELPAILRPGDLMVFNDTKVIPAQLRGRRTNPGGAAGIDVTLIRRDAADARLWQALARPAKKLRVGDVIDFAADTETDAGRREPSALALSAEVTGKQESGEISLRFDCEEGAVMAAIHRLGSMPLPPYIRKLRPVAREDESDYQTVYARHEGAVAAPTAGLHFTPELLAALDARGIERVHVTLHVGAGTFLPVKVEAIEDHRMHAEWGEVTAEVAARYNRARAEGRRIVAVGTTSLRLLESALDRHGTLQAFNAETEIFIHPGKQVRSADLLLTNFHLPKSTLFMLVCAFAGTARMKQAYAHAIDTGYRFFSYGDACLLEHAA
ncbi:MAG TPA: tRNA preQ1(34) S-adenosylmethionine ribosyltransferase-isomerase QueA [Dongiaceae bacterium]|nr:tRNA preQ1(34) S-adenosylmethionine ribosyltransferase-isomerase QueA [Dongiaceae bacterium]